MNNPVDPGWMGVAFWMVPHHWLRGVPQGMHIAARQNDGRWFSTAGGTFSDWDELMTWARSMSSINLGIHEVMLNPDRTSGRMLDAVNPF